jgi:para-aminobenzoate synthetase/4-amino-4-deoxychorismate lyase
LALFPSEFYPLVASAPGSVLLETSLPDRENWRSFLFLNPATVLKADALAEIPALFDRIAGGLDNGMYAAGYISYECGGHFEPHTALRAPAPSGLPLAWFGLYPKPFVFDHRTGAFDPAPPEWRRSPSLPANTSESRVSACRLAISQDDYALKVEKIRGYIAAGHTYQVNFTTKVLFECSGSADGLFAALREQQKVPYAAFLNLGETHILSFSPELFFRIQDGRISARPMKGTAPRGRYVAEDALLGRWLREDPKNLSEHVMIVDLLRNDIGKIAEVGSVRVEDLFSVEKHETLFQMTSTVSGTLRRKASLYDIFQAIFPSGSVTGAPKCRTMQIIQELEGEPRGIYTGAIGYVSPSRQAVFSVPIRTLILRAGSGQMGVGSGIVFDSLARGEYEECLLKARFLTHPRPDFQLIETLRWDGEYRFLPLHLERLKSSAEYFGFSFDEREIRSALKRRQERLAPGRKYRVRLLLNAKGDVSVEDFPLESGCAPDTVVLSPFRTSSGDPFLFHKTTFRDSYDRIHAAAVQQGHADVLFLNEREEVTEGAVNNVFLEMEGQLFTPPVECGLLPGVYRRHLLEVDPRVAERILTAKDLRSAEAVYLCNSVRGLREVRVVEAAANENQHDGGKEFAALAGTRLASTHTGRASNNREHRHGSPK